MMAPRCTHGAIKSSKMTRALHNLSGEVEILKKEDVSAKTKKKVFARVDKLLLRISKDKADALRQVIAQWNGLAASALFECDFEALSKCRAQAILVEFLILYEYEPDAVKDFQFPVDIRRDVAQHQAVILSLAELIPCDCLKEAKKNVKKQGKIGVCLECKKESPAKEQFTCSRCKVAHYCSTECQYTHWKSGHKEQCRPPKIDEPQAMHLLNYVI